MADTWTDVDTLVPSFCCNLQKRRCRGSLRRSELLPGSMWRYRVVDETVHRI